MRHAAAVTGNPGAMLAAAVADFAERTRRHTASWWRGGSACDGWSRGDVVAHVVARYADWHRALTARPGPPVPVRPYRDDALPDRLAVTGRELVAALAAVPAGASVEVGELGPTTAGGLAVIALGETVLHRWDVDATRPAGPVAAAVVAHGLGRPAPEAATATDLLLLLTGRGGATGDAAWRWLPTGTEA